MLKQPLLIFSWFFISVGLILSSVAGFHLVFEQSSELTQNVELQSPLITDFSATQTILAARGSVKGVATDLNYDDSRAVIVANFLERYKAPLTPYDYYGKLFVDIADKYGIDFRLLPAIAMQESNLCKVIPPGTYNCLGFGIHKRGTLGFDNYQAGFERAARELKANYIDRGLTSPEEIMTKYTPSSNGSWAASVNQWMSEMRYDDRQLGRERKTNANLFEFVGTTPASPSSSVR